jgi:lactoylglutathione lyase
VLHIILTACSKANSFTEGAEIMKYLHTMIRVTDLDQSVDFFANTLGLVETRRKEVEAGRFTLVFFATAPGEPEVDLTYNWD